MSEVKPLTPEESQKWVREQYLKATKYLSGKGFVTNSVAVQSSRYLPPVVAVWKLKTIDNKEVWVISGDLPCDHIVSTAAENVRETLRNFSMKWQLQAENLLQTATDKTQHDFAQILISRAEGLYQLFENEKLWVNG